MDRIALIADIHGNMPALDAAEADIKRREVNSIYCLGDMISRGPDFAAAVDWCRANCKIVLPGNNDLHAVTGARKDYAAEIGEERREWIASLPLYHRMWMSGRRIHMFHGRPLYPPPIWPDTPDAEKLALFGLIEDEFPPDILAVADVHRQYKTDFHNNPRFMFNTGSIGCSYCSPTACYAILSGVEGGRDLAPISVEFVSVPYDNEKAAENARNSGKLPSVDDYIKEITLGIWQNLKY
ncbi:MAG: metallophosphoesterase [Defluviitaleaceae bacterium]|nr:metallophosphoesterase [Defluviitaleaceae bacterium]